MKGIRALAQVLALVFILSIGGVCATWSYAQGVCNPVVENIKIDAFPWQGSEILPEDDQIGQNHRTLIEKILNGAVTDENGNVEQGLGLNYENSYLNTEIKDRSGSWLAGSDTLGSMDFWEKQDIDKYFNTSTENLSFVLYFPEGVDDTYYLYTTGVALGGSNSPNIAIGEDIYPIYRTVLVKNAEGAWVAEETKLGYAESAWYDNRITGGLLRYPSFSPSTWQEGEKGTSVNNAIWAYKGENTAVALETDSTEIFYKIKPSARTTYTVYSANESVKIIVMRANQNQVTVTDGAQGSNRLTFDASANQTYYIKLVGAKSMQFSIS